MTALDNIDMRFKALERAWASKATTPTLAAGFASVRAAIDAGLRTREAYLRGPWSAPHQPIQQPPDSVEDW